MKLLVKYNPYHDSRGRFTSPGAATSFSLLANPLHRARSIEREKERTASMKTYPPGGGKLTQEAMATIDNYLAPFTQYKPTDIDSPDKIEGITSTAKALTETYKNYVEEGLLTLEDLPNKTDMRLVGADGELMAIGYATKYIPSEIRLITKKTMVVTGKIYLNTDQELAEYAKSTQSRMTFARTDEPGRQAFIDHEMGHVLHITIKNRYAEQIYKEAREESARNKDILAKNPYATGTRSHNEVSVEAAGKLNKKIYQLDNKVAKIIEDELSTGKLLVDRRLTQNSLRDVLTAQSNKPRPLSSHDQTKIKHNLSSYASTDISETIAEAWTEYRNSKNPRPIARKIGQLIEGELRATHTRDAANFEKSRKIEKYNPHHDSKGRFASASGGSGISATEQSPQGHFDKETMAMFGFTDTYELEHWNYEAMKRVAKEYSNVDITDKQAKDMVLSVRSFTGPEHKMIRRAQMDRDDVNFRGNKDSYKAKAEMLEKFIQVSPKYVGTLHRGVEKRKELQPGDEITMGGVSSWSSDYNIASQRFTEGGKGMVYTVRKSTQGASVKHLASRVIRDENEVILPSTVKYRVVKAGMYDVELEEIVTKYNPYHDARGRFASAGAASSFSLSSNPKLSASSIANEKAKNKERLIGELSSGIVSKETLIAYGYPDMKTPLILSKYLTREERNSAIAEAMVKHYNDAGIPISYLTADTYATAVAEYTRGDYRKVRNGEDPESVQQRTVLRHIADNSMPIKQDIYRGSGTTTVYQVGDVIKTKDLNSYSPDKNVAINFAASQSAKPGNYPVIYTFPKSLGIKAAPLGHISKFDHEKEVLAGTGKEYRVKEVINHGKKISFRLTNLHGTKEHGGKQYRDSDRDMLEYILEEVVTKHNPYHDSRGRFTSPGGGGSAGTSATIVDELKSGALSRKTFRKYGFPEIMVPLYESKYATKGGHEARQKDMATAMTKLYNDAGIPITQKQAESFAEAIAEFTTGDYKAIRFDDDVRSTRSRKALLQVIEKTPALTAPAYRGVARDEVYKVGDTIDVKRLSSYSVDKNSAIDFAVNHSEQGVGMPQKSPAVFTVPKGLKAIPIGHMTFFDHEQEVLAGNPKQYRVKEVINHGKDIKWKLTRPLIGTKGYGIDYNAKTQHDLMEYVLEEVVTKMNPYHDALGRFTFTSGGSIGGSPHAKVNGKDISGTIAGEKAVALYKLRNTESNKEDRAMVAIAKQQGFTGKPEVLSSEEFDKRVQELVDNAIVMYRGMTDSAYVDQLKNGEYYGGTGGYGSGIYASSSANYADSYTVGRDAQNNFTIGGRHNIAKIVVDRRSVKLITVEEANREYKKYLEKENAKNDDSIPGQCRKEVLSDAGRFLASKGYDGMEITFGNTWQADPPQYVMFNRTALTILEGKAPGADFAGGQ